MRRASSDYVDAAQCRSRAPLIAKAACDSPKKLTPIKGLHAHFSTVLAKRKYGPNDVDAGRAYSNAYVEFVHYAERLYAAAETLSPEHATAAGAGHTH